MKKIVKISLTIFAIAFALNWIWENLHAPFYGGYEGFFQFLPLISIASVWDGIMVLGIYAAVAAVFRDMEWIKSPNRASVSLAVVLGLAMAVYIELRAMREGRWSYKAIMPLIPILKIGLLPVLQMMILPILTYKLSAKLIR
jgi:hypothetical protein